MKKYNHMASLQRDLKTYLATGGNLYANAKGLLWLIFALVDKEEIARQEGRRKNVPKMLDSPYLNLRYSLQKYFEASDDLLDSIKRLLPMISSALDDECTRRQGGVYEP